MTLPHEPAFTLRPYLFWGAALASVASAARVSGLETRSLAAGIGGTAAIAVALYYYARWIIRLDGRFHHVHPRKILVTTLVSFYAPAVAALALAGSSPWPMRVLLDSPFEKAAVFLAIPCLLAASAGALRGGRESGVIV